MIGSSKVKQTSVGLAVLALALGSAACGSSGSSSGSPGSTHTKGNPVKIGYLASLTGFCSAFSKEYVDGAQLAVKQINSAGGVLGHPLQLQVRDDQATPDVGVRQARDLVLSDGVKFLAGTCSSAVGQSIRKLVADPSHVPYVAGVVDSAIFQNAKGSYVFGTLPTTDAEGTNAANIVKQQSGVKTISLLGEDYSYSHQVYAAFKRALQGTGIKVVSEDYVQPGAANYSSYVNRVLSKNPDMVYSTLITDDNVTFAKQAIPLGFYKKTKVVGIEDYGTLAGMSKAPDGVLGYSYYPSASIYATPMAKQLAPLGIQEANSGAAGDGFNQIQILAQGMKKANSIDPTAVARALDNAELEVVQGKVKMNPCSHVMGMPIANGTVTSPTSKLPFPHFANIKLSPSSSGENHC